MNAKSGLFDVALEAELPPWPLAEAICAAIAAEWMR
jgi:hypothetical protein